MIQIDMPMPKQCDDCRFCEVDYTDDDKPDSSAYCYVKERFIELACDGTDKVVSTAILKRQPWCPLIAQEPRVLTLDEYRAIAEKPRSERVPVWIEWRDGGYAWAIPQRAYEVYGETWRAWTDRPTDEMRGEVAWETMT